MASFLSPLYGMLKQAGKNKLNQEKKRFGFDADRKKQGSSSSDADSSAMEKKRRRPARSNYSGR